MEFFSGQRKNALGGRFEMATEEPQKLVGTVARVTEFLRYLAEHEDEVTITALSRDLSLPPSTVHRLLHLLIEQGFVERGQRFQSYRIGNELYRLGCLISSRGALPELAEPFMNELVAETNEFSMLCLYLPAERALTLVRAVSAPNTLTYQIEKFSTMSIGWGASGRAILAHFPESEIRAIYDATGPSPVTGASLPLYAKFSAEMQTIRTRGYAKTSGQKVAGAVGLASAVFGPAGNAVASLCLTIPDFRFDPSREPRLGRLLREKAAQLSHASGYVSATPVARGAKRMRSTTK
jgi:DNA-binding IclR family transcriptional regulator